MSKTVTQWLGLDKQADFLKHHFVHVNAFVGLYAGGLLAALWLLAAVVSAATAGKAGQALAFAAYLVLAAANVVLLLASRTALRTDAHEQRFHVTLVAYIVLNVVAGAYLSLSSYAAGGQTLLFLIVEMLCVCLYVLPPVGTVALTFVSFGTFVLFLNAQASVSLVLGLELLFAWAIITAIGIMRYWQTRNVGLRERDLKSLSILDELTGMRNRRALRLDFASYIGQPVVAAMLDVDDFKYYNDVYGHERGDEVLKEFSELLFDHFPAEGLYRYGGDEFLVLLGDATEAEFLGVIADWKRDLAERNRVRRGARANLDITSSIGYVHGEAVVEDDLRRMIALADDKLYDSKQHGKDRTTGSAYTGGVDAAAQAAIIAERRAFRDLDELTGLPSREAFRRSATQLLRQAAREHTAVDVVYFDIEHFKMFNSRYGFEAGDELLKIVGGAIKREFSLGVTARFSDDHFVAAVPVGGSVNDHIARVREEACAYRPETPIELKAGVFEFFPDEGDINIGTAYDRATMACDSIKGRYDVAIARFDAELERTVARNHYIVNNLDRAIELGYLKMHFQPIVRSTTGRMCDIEGLVRWEDPQFGLITPAEFIGVLEDARLIHKVDIFMVRRACEIYRDMAARGVELVPISINLSRLDFDLCDISSLVDGLLADYGVPRHAVHFELTESVLGDSSEGLSASIDAFREHGHEVWIDDFGSGYSSFNSLSSYRFDVLKLDMKFFSAIGLDIAATPDSVTYTQTRQVVATIIDMAKKLGIQTIAEGVENEVQHEFLRQMGCEKLQGFLFGRPRLLDADGVLEFERELGLEPFAQRAYYDAIGRANMLSADALVEWDRPGDAANQPFALVEEANGALSYVEANSTYLELVRARGRASTLSESAAEFNDVESPLRAIALGLFSRCVQSGGIEWLNCEVDGESYTAKARCIASREDANVFLVVVRAHHRISDE